MRTTLSIDDDVLAAAKNLATRERRSVGEIISTLARQARLPAAAAAETRNGIAIGAALPKPAGAFVLA